MEHRPLRILQLSPYYPPLYSGASRQAHRINRRLVARGVEIDVLTAGKGAAMSDAIDGVRVIRLGEAIESRRTLAAWVARVQGFLLARGRRYRVLHILGSYMYSAPPILLAKALGLPVLVKGTMLEGDVTFRRLHQRLRMRMVALADRFVSLNSDMTSLLLRHGWKPEKLLTVPNGVDTGQFHPVSAEEKARLRKELGLHGEFIACYVGLFNRRKGADFLLEVWREFAERHASATLLMIGPTDEAPFMEEMLSRHKPLFDSGAVRYDPFQENIHRWLQASDVFLFPTTKEGLPNALLEAMAVGLPSLGCDDVPVVVELLDDGCGVLSRRERAEYLQHLERLHDRPELRAALGSSARRRVERHYSLDRVVEIYFDLYRELAGDSRGK